MPKIDEVHIKKTKKFQKKEYRPWDTPVLKEESSDPVDYVLQEKIPEKSLKSVNAVECADNKKDEYLLLTEKKNFSFEKIKRGLFGPQEQILNYLIGRIESVDGDFHYISPIYYSEVSEKLKITIYSLKANLNKFKKLGLIELVEFKPGRGGYCFFRMSKPAVEFFST